MVNWIWVLRTGTDSLVQVWWGAEESFTREGRGWGGAARSLRGRKRTRGRFPWGRGGLPVDDK